MKIINLLIFTISLISINTKTLARERSIDDKVICEKQKGVWREFGNDCANDCHALDDGANVCASNIVYSCDCEEKKCWDSINKKCLYIKTYKEILTKEEAKEIQELKKIEEEEKLEEKIKNNPNPATYNSNTKNKIFNYQNKEEKNPVTDLLNKLEKEVLK